MRTEACSCGGNITVPDGDEPLQYVAAHNESTSHEQWRGRMGIPLPNDDPRRPTADRDLSGGASAAEGAA